jgi:uroporphyrinogen decarboxylase
MEPRGLKTDFGNDIAFHGGIDIQFLLPLSGPQHVAAETGRICRIMGDEGGYILAPSHNIQPDVPTENILAMYGLDARRF